MSFLSREELAWAGGLFEGEGSFGLRRDKHPWAKLNMTDEDAVQRFAKAVGFGKVRGPYIYPTRPDTTKPYWVWVVDGFPRTQALVAMLWPFLCQRRKAKAREVLLRGRGVNLSQAMARRPRDAETGRWLPTQGLQSAWAKEQRRVKA